MINKFIKILGPIVQILIVIIFVIISLPNNGDEFKLITDNTDLNKKISTSSGLFVSNAIIEIEDTEVVPHNYDNGVTEEVKEDKAEAIIDEKVKHTFKNSDYKVIESFVGTLTGYGPDCKGCKSGKTSTGYKVADVVDGIVQPAFTITYTDEEFGEVRILAAAHAKFPKGSIIRITDFELYDNAFIGIVIDTGYTMRNAWSNGDVWMDLLFETEKDPVIKSFGIDKNVKFEVLRYGY